MAKKKSPSAKPRKDTKLGIQAFEGTIGDVREARTLGRQELIKAMSSVLALPRYHIEVLAKDNYANGATALMASVLKKGIDLGCPGRANMFLAYMLGRPIEYDPTADTAEDASVSKAEALPSELLIKIARELIADSSGSAR